MKVIELDGQWFVADEKSDLHCGIHCGPYATREEAQDWIGGVKSTDAPGRVSADKIALLLSEDARPRLENTPYLAVKIAEGIESGELLQ